MTPAEDAASPSATAPGKPVYTVRPYAPADRATLRHICCETGFLSHPVDPLFEDRELFADYLTSYYTDREPESTFVCELNGVVKGYLMGCRLPREQAKYDRFANLSLVARGAWRYYARPYNEASRKFVRWVIANGRKQKPFSPPDTPHFHVNLLPEARKVATTVFLFETFFEYLQKAGETAVYGQMTTYETRRGPRMFARYGFEVIDQVEVTKYRDLSEQKVYLFTIRKDLTKNVKMYGLDLHKLGAKGGVDDE